MADIKLLVALVNLGSETLANWLPTADLDSLIEDIRRSCLTALNQENSREAFSKCFESVVVPAHKAFVSLACGLRDLRISSLVNLYEPNVEENAVQEWLSDNNDFGEITFLAAKLPLLETPGLLTGSKINIVIATTHPENPSPDWRIIQVNSFPVSIRQPPVAVQSPVKQPQEYPKSVSISAYEAQKLLREGTEALILPEGASSIAGWYDVDELVIYFWRELKRVFRLYSNAFAVLLPNRKVKGESVELLAPLEAILSAPTFPVVATVQWPSVDVLNQMKTDSDVSAKSSRNLFQALKAGVDALDAIEPFLPSNSQYSLEIRSVDDQPALYLVNGSREPLTDVTVQLLSSAGEVSNQFQVDRVERMGSLLILSGNMIAEWKAAGVAYAKIASSPDVLALP